MASERMCKAMVKALAIIAAGMPTFGRWPSAGRTPSEQQVAKKAMEQVAYAYIVACENEPKITEEILEITAKRYLQGEVSIMANGEWTKPTEFPSSAQFKDACLQTWHLMFKIVAIGETKDDKGYTILHSETVPRSLEGRELSEFLAIKQKALGITPMLPESTLKGDEVSVRRYFGNEYQPPKPERQKRPVPVLSLPTAEEIEEANRRKELLRRQG